jgi:enoyl-CoA hydratase/carnithine racemase
MPGFDTLLFDKLDAVAHIRLNRPNVLNAYNMQMRDDFSLVLAAVQDDPDIGAILITGEGRAFCAGADLTEFGTAPSQAVARQVRWQRDVWGQFLNLSKPIVIAVHGYCIGSGLEITLLGDLRLAAQGTIFALPEVQLGMIPAAGGSQTLPRNSRQGGALDVLFTGRRFDAAEALTMGLVTRIISPDDLLEEAMEAAHLLAGSDTDVVAAIKTALRLGQDLPLAEALDLETRLAAGVIG